MAAHSSAIYCVSVFVDVLAEWVEAPWDASIDIPYVIAVLKIGRSLSTYASDYKF